MVGDEQSDEWFIVNNNIRIAKACFTESKNDVILGIDWIPRNSCSSSQANDWNILVHPPSSQKSSKHSCLLALESQLDIWRQSLNGLLIIRPDVKDNLMEYGTRIPACILFISRLSHQLLRIQMSNNNKSFEYCLHFICINSHQIVPLIPLH